MQEQQKEKNFVQALEPNIAAALSYILTPITGVVFFLMEKDNKFVRFHAFQSILFGVAIYVAYTVASFLTVILIGLILLPIVMVGSVVIWFLLMWKAYNNEEYELPFLGKIAHQQVNKQG